jgi:hypothetical protein
MDQITLKDLFEYRDDNLYWKEYPSKFNHFDITKPAGWINNFEGYRYIRFDGKNHSAHRLIWVYHYGEIPKGLTIDHKNHITNDNRLENLRLATRNQQVHHRRLGKNNKSGFKGVTWHKFSGRWRARIGVNGKQIFLGYFDCPKEAHAAYCRAADEYHDEFANYG